MDVLTLEQRRKKQANRNKWLKTHILNNNLYDVHSLKSVEECQSKMILARYFYTIIKYT